MEFSVLCTVGSFLYGYVVLFLQYCPQQEPPTVGGSC